VRVKLGIRFCEALVVLGGCFDRCLSCEFPVPYFKNDDRIKAVSLCCNLLRIQARNRTDNCRLPLLRKGNVARASGCGSKSGGATSLAKALCSSMMRLPVQSRSASAVRPMSVAFATIGVYGLANWVCRQNAFFGGNRSHALFHNPARPAERDGQIAEDVFQKVSCQNIACAMMCCEPIEESKINFSASPRSRYRFDMCQPMF